MKITIAYIAVTNGPLTADYAARFVASHHEFPPGLEHETVVACNGGPLRTAEALIFSGLNAVLYPRSNEAWDIGAYLELAKGLCRDSDMILCCGESVYFHRPGWLKRLADTWQKYGPGMYGTFASNMIRAHLQTTCFAAAPDLLRSYPPGFWRGNDRYAFEHGPNAFWRWCQKCGRPVRCVTWDGDWGPREWRNPPEILWRGTQTNCLMFSNHTEHYANAKLSVRQNWARGADRKYE